MTEEEHTELDRIFSENTRMERALKDIATAQRMFKPQNKSQRIHAMGIAMGLQAAANIANNTLKENQDGRTKEEARTS